MPDIDRHAISSSGTNWLAFSGGPDSACLLHLLMAEGLRSRIRAVHVDHGLDDQSGARAARALEIAESMGVECTLARLDLGHLQGDGGPEAVARRARYARLQSLINRDDYVLTAHHADDQVETVMLRLLRGAGPAGLRGMQPLRRLAPGWLGRPLLSWTRADILEYVHRHQVDYLHDPTNRDLSLDRNYLRHGVLPEIERRWPGYRSSILQSSQWQAAASRALEDESGRNLEALVRINDRSGETTLDAARWLELDAETSFSVIRAWCMREALIPPPTRPLREFRAQCATARQDRQPGLEWPEGYLRAWRGRLWMDLAPAIPPDWRCEWLTGDRCRLPAGGSLAWFGAARSRFGKHWQISAAPASARLRLHPNASRQAVSELMREAGIPPWRRRLFPALSIDGRLCAVGVDWLDCRFAERLSRHDSRLEWQHRPAALIT